MKNKKIIIVYVALILMLCYAGCSDKWAPKGKSKTGEGTILTSNISNENLEKIIEKKVDLKEYSRLKTDECRMELSKIQNGHLGDAKVKEDGFRKKYQDILEFYVNLKEIKFKLKESKKKIEDIINQIETLKNLREDKDKLEINSIQIFKQSLGAIPGYYILLGKKSKQEKSLEQVKEEIRNQMELFLQKHESVFEIESDTAVQGDSIQRDSVKRLVIKTSVPDNREDAFENNNIIYMYKVYKVYAHYRTFENVDLNNITTFKIPGHAFSPGEADVDIKVINIPTGVPMDSAVVEILRFFNITSKYTPKYPAFVELIKNIKSNMADSQKEISNLYEDFNNKLKISSSSINEIDNRLDSLIKTLEDDQFEFNTELKQNINQLIHNINKFSWLDTNGSFNRYKDIIQKEKANIKKEITGNILESLKKNKNDRIDLGNVRGHISMVTDLIDEISQNIRQALTSLTRGRRVEYLKIERQKEDPRLDVKGNFQKAAINAFEAIKNEEITSFGNIIEIDKDGNIFFRKAMDYYKEGKIIRVELPFLADVVKKDETDSDTHEFIVAVKAAVIFDMKAIQHSIEEKNGFILDFKNNMIWTKDYPDTRNFIIFESMEGKKSVQSQLEEMRKQNPGWQLISRKELEILLMEKELFTKLGLQYNRSYWTTERKSQYYKAYRFIKNQEGLTELTFEYRASDDGAYCILVRKKQEGEDYE